MINAGRLELSRTPVVWWNLCAAFTFMLTLVLSANLFASAVREAFRPETGPQNREEKVVLRISNMVTEILTSEDTVRVVDGLSLTLNRGEICALVGESGCGKSMTAFSLLRLLPSSGRVSSGVVTVDGTEIMGLPEAAMRNIRSFKISLIFQEPATSLNPVMTVGDQIVETILLHTPLRGEEARAKALDWLKKVGIPEPERRMKSFPFELSGGQKQRV